MKRKLCFATYEIHPTTRGGAGVLLANLTHVLVATGYEVVLVLDIAEHEFRRFVDVDRLNIPRPEACRAYHVDTLCSDLYYTESDFDSHYAWRSYRFHHACLKVVTEEHPDAIEFVDYCGVAYYALAAKVAGLAYANTHLVVRLHTSIEILDTHEAVRDLQEDRYKLYALEHAALRLAESIVYPSTTFYEKAYRPHYSHWLGKTWLATPPLLRVPQLDAPSPNADIVLYYGRLFGLKGIDRFVDAAVLYLQDPGNRRLRFALCGYDSNQPPDNSPTYTEYLRNRIPEKFRGQFMFTGQLDWEQLRALSANFLFAVFPNFFESFCYAAHELYAAGLPLIVSDIPAFADFFQGEKNVLQFDGTTTDLCDQMKRLSIDDSLRNRLRVPYTVAGATVGAFYETPRWSSWMEVASAPPTLQAVVCILERDDPRGLKTTLDSLEEAQGIRILVLRASKEQASGSPSRVRILGGYFDPVDAKGQPVAPESIKTQDAFLFVNSGDRVDPDFIHKGLGVFAKHSSIGYVSCWFAFSEDQNKRVDTHPLGVLPEYTALKMRPYPLRCLLRSRPGRLLTEFLDSRLEEFGELGIVWEHEAAGSCGICIPTPLIRVGKAETKAIGKRGLSFLFLNKAGPQIRDRLATFCMVILNAAEHPSDVLEMASQLKASEQELKLLRSSLGWRLTITTRAVRQRIIDILTRDPVIGRRLVDAWLGIRERLIAGHTTDSTHDRE